MLEIRIHGRGGQGSVTLAELIATAAFYSGSQVQAFPNFGVERRGAPVEAYVRIADKFIQRRDQIYNPDYIIIQDDSLLGVVDVVAGLKKGGLVLINTEKAITDLGFKKGQFKVVALPATKIGTEVIGKEIINTVLLGAFAAIGEEIKFKAIEKAIKERFEGEVAKKNIEAAKKGFEIINENF